jgi:hypothetical protein
VFGGQNKSFLPTKHAKETKGFDNFCFVIRISLLSEHPCHPGNPWFSALSPLVAALRLDTRLRNAPARQAARRLQPKKS